MSHVHKLVEKHMHSEATKVMYTYYAGVMVHQYGNWLQGTY